MERGWFPQVLPHSRQRSSYRAIATLFFLASSWGRARKRVPKTGNLFSGYKEKRLRDAEMRHPESHVPRFRARVDTGRPGFNSRSGCRGFNGLVPQPLCMKSKVCSEEQTCGANADRIRREMSRAAYRRMATRGREKPMNSRRTLRSPRLIFSDCTDSFFLSVAHSRQRETNQFSAYSAISAVDLYRLY